MKSLTSLWSCAAEELAARCCTSATLDVKYVERRTEHEGISFLAISLADLGKATQKWLDQGFVVSSDCPAFKRAGGRSRLPAFLSGFYRRVFCPVSGALLDDYDIEAIYAIRQLTLMFSKIALPRDPSNGKSQPVVTPAREKRAMSDFVQCEQDVKYADSVLDPSYKEDFRRISTVLFKDMFDWAELNLSLRNVLPRHGPGAVAERLTSNGKFMSRTWTSRLQSVFPAEAYLDPSGHFDSGSSVAGDCYSHSASAYCYKLPTSGFDILEPEAEMPVRVITVPKTLKSPRTIAIEPSCMQYTQQALFALFRDGFERFHPLSSMIGIDDQDPNRSMAQEGSRSGNLATLDLSEASDRVSNQHVRDLFAGHPLLLEAVQACRSRKADVPGHGVLRLAKFASMGSALCFPVEAMVFLTTIFIGIERELSAPLSELRDITPYAQQVRVFGDDLIVPRDYVLSVVDELHAFGHRVNISKSFWTGRFRESCGREFYDGHDVSIVKVRRELPTRLQDVNEVVSAVSLRNQLYWAGLWQSAGWMDNHLGKVLKYFPNVAPTSSLLGRESALGYQFSALDPNTHAPVVLGHYMSAELRRDPLDGAGALLKCLLRLERVSYGFISVRDTRETPFGVASIDSEHLERSGRPEHVSIKLGRKSPF